MTVGIRRALTDADLEAWRSVRRAVLPGERTATVDEMRARMTPDQLHLVAELDGEIVGSGIAGRSDLAGSSFVAPRVVPEARRRGVGTALLRELTEHVASLGYADAGGLVDDDGSLAFAERFGFREVARQVEQVRAIGDEEWPRVPADIDVVSLGDRPDLFDRVYSELAVEAFQDFAVERPLDVSLDDWRREWLTWPEGSFVALEDGRVIACAGLLGDDDRPDRAENALTAVRRDRRRRGLASLLKRMTIAWAAENGVREIYTWTQRGNGAMRAVNERLGYEVRSVCINVRGQVPLAR